MIGQDSLYELGSLPVKSMASLQAHFANLPLDTYTKDRLRSRRYSCYMIGEGHKPRKMTQKDFMQTSDINNFLGDVHRKYEPIDDALLTDPVFLSMFDEFRARTGLGVGDVIEAHQIRWHCKRFVKIPAPEGIHKDGFDFVAMYMVNTHNISGGDIMIYETLESCPMFRKQLEPGEYVVLDDKQLYHYAAPLVPMANDEEGYWDLIVLTANAQAKA